MDQRTREAYNLSNMDRHGRPMSRVRSQQDDNPQDMLPTSRDSGVAAGRQTSLNPSDGIIEMEQSVQDFKAQFYADLNELHAGIEKNYSTQDILMLYRNMVRSYDAFHERNKFLLEMLGRSDSNKERDIMLVADSVNYTFDDTKRLMDQMLRQRHESVTTRVHGNQLARSDQGQGQRSAMSGQVGAAAMTSQGGRQLANPRLTQESGFVSASRDLGVIGQGRERTATPMPFLPVTQTEAERMYQDGIAALGDRFQQMSLSKIEDDSEDTFSLPPPRSPPPTYRDYVENVDESLYRENRNVTQRGDRQTEGLSREPSNRMSEYSRGHSLFSPNTTSYTNVSMDMTERSAFSPYVPRDNPALPRDTQIASLESLRERARQNANEYRSHGASHDPSARSHDTRMRAQDPAMTRSRSHDTNMRSHDPAMPRSRSHDPAMTRSHDQQLQPDHYGIMSQPGRERQDRRVSWDDPISYSHHVDDVDNDSESTLVLPPPSDMEAQCGDYLSDSEEWLSRIPPYPGEPLPLFSTASTKRRLYRRRDSRLPYTPAWTGRPVPEFRSLMYPYTGPVSQSTMPRHARVNTPRPTAMPENSPILSVDPNRRFLVDYMLGGPMDAPAPAGRSTPAELYYSPENPMLDLGTSMMYDTIPMSSNEVIEGSAYEMRSTTSQSSNKSVMCENCCNPNSRKNTYCGFCRHTLPHVSSQRSSQSHTSMSTNAQSELSNIAQIWKDSTKALIDYQGAPKMELMTYDGDPAGFEKYWNTFRQLVDLKGFDSSYKLNQLYRSTEGVAQNIVDPYLNEADVDTAYADAKRELFRRCGHPTLVSAASLAKVLEGDQISANDITGLEKYLSGLRAVQSSMKKLKKEKTLQDPNTMGKLSARLPQFMQRDWHRYVGQRKYRDLAYEETFSEFLEFLQLQLFQKTLPGYTKDPRFNKKDEKQDDKKDDKKKGRFHGRQAQTGNDAPSNPAVGDARPSGGDGDAQKSRLPDCPACAMNGGPKINNHKLKDCEKFKKLSQDQRLTLVMDSKFCFNCLTYTNHPAIRCKAPKMCPVDNCDVKHHVLIHYAHLRLLERINAKKGGGAPQQNPNARQSDVNKDEGQRQGRQGRRQGDEPSDRAGYHDDRRGRGRGRESRERGQEVQNIPEVRQTRHTGSEYGEFDDIIAEAAETPNARISEAQTQTQSRTTVVPKQAMKRNADGSECLQYTCGMQVILVANQDSDFYEEAVAYLDDGANCCHVAPTLQRRLGIADNKQTGAIVTATGLVEEVFTPAKIKIKGLKSKMKPEQIAVRCVDHYPCAEIAYINTKKFPELENIDFGPRRAGRLTEITLGTNCFASTVVLEEVRMGPKKPIAKRNQLGWYLTGCTGEGQQE